MQQQNEISVEGKKALKLGVSSVNTDTNRLENLLHSLREKNGRIQSNFYDKVFHMVKSTYDHFLGTSYSFSETAKSLQKEYHAINSLIKDNEVVGKQLSKNVYFVENECENLESKLNGWLARSQDLQNKLDEKKTNYENLQNDLKNLDLSTSEQYMIKMDSRKHKMDVDVLERRKNIIENQSEVFMETYHQQLSELSNEKLLYDVQLLNQDILESRLSLVKLYMDRERSGSDEIAVMRARLGLAKSSKVISETLKNRANAVKQYNDATENMTPYHTVCSAERVESEKIQDDFHGNI